MPAPKPKLLPVEVGPSAESLAVVRRGVRSLSKAAVRIGMSKSFVKLLIKDGVLSSFKVGRNRVVPVVELDRYLAEQRDQQCQRQS